MKLSTILAIFTGLAASSPVSGRNASDEVGHTMKFGGFSYGGTGCPQNSIGHTLSDDGSLLNLKYDSLSVHADKNVPIPDRRKFC
ncbi:MAG: DUF4360 domain-containing protein, partial [Bacteroidales bacterium]|nr:DUF4360 domain-containing protein [Bacteroidales bacterium]